jgi:hypothetical protein
MFVGKTHHANRWVKVVVHMVATILISTETFARLSAALAAVTVSHVTEYIRC